MVVTVLALFCGFFVGATAVGVADHKCEVKRHAVYQEQSLKDVQSIK